MHGSFKANFWITGLAAALVGLSFAACGDGETTGDDDGASSGGRSGGSGGKNGSGSGGALVGGEGGVSVDPDAPAVYAVATQQLNTDGLSTSYVLLTDTLKADLKVADAVLEVPGRGIAAGPVGGETLFVGTDKSGLLTRYVLEGDRLKESGTLQFEAQQVPNFGGYSAQFQFISDDKAYWFSRLAAKIVVWDPEEFVILGSIPLPEIAREDPGNPGSSYITSFTGAPLRSGNTLYSFVSWDSRLAGVVKVPPASALVVVDTESDSAEVFLDERCGYARDGVLIGDWLYLVTEALGSSVHFLNEDNGPAPCILRFDTKKKEFDRSFQVDLNSLAGGAPTGSLLVSPEGETLVHVLDVAQAEPLIPAPINNPRILSSADLWRTARLTLGDSPSLELLDNPLISASVLPFTLRNGFRVAPTFGQAPHIYEVTGDGLLPTERADATIPGTVFSIVQLR